LKVVPNGNRALVGIGGVMNLIDTTYKHGPTRT
jgi:hypothetical protein